jgi:hypothetical protein
MPFGHWKCCCCENKEEENLLSNNLVKDVGRNVGVSFNEVVTTMAALKEEEGRPSKILPQEVYQTPIKMGYNDF